MLEGRCPKCGYRCYGWVLRFPRNQSCPKCGAALEIYEEGKRVSQGYSPFTADKYVIDLPAGSKPARDKARKGKEQERKWHS